MVEPIAVSKNYFKSVLFNLQNIRLPEITYNALDPIICVKLIFSFILTLFLISSIIMSHL